MIREGSEVWLYVILWLMMIAATASCLGMIVALVDRADRVSQTGRADGGVFRKRLRSERPVSTDPGTLPKAQLREPGIFDHDNDPMHDCMEQYEFRMSRRAHGFDMGLSLVLTCLSFAGAQGALPQLAPNWWVDVCCK